MEGTFDVIVVGLGAMGSATVYHLSKQHGKVLGLEAFTPAHDKGSSHGESRIIRQAYFEDPAYVPLVLRAYELWDELQNESNHEILSITGGVAIGSPRRALITGCLKSARRYGLEHDLLNAREMRQRFPQFALADDEVAFYEKKAGYLKPEECIRQHLRCASKRGADLRFEEPVLSWRASQSGDGVSVTTEKEIYQARSLVISVGPWFAELVPDVSMPVIVSRRVMFWLKPASQSSAFDRRIFPIFIWQPEQGPIHSEGEECTPSTIGRVISSLDETAIRSAISSRIPALNGEVSHAATCMYTMTPDEHFIIDAHPAYPQVSLAAGFSGHGFKFSSVVGEILSDLAMKRETSSDIALFSGSRFRLQ